MPILIPYVAGTKEGWREGLKATLVFSLSRLSAYVLLGLIAGFSGEIVLSLLSQQEFGFYVWFLGGVFVSLLGLLITWGKEPKIPLYQLFKRHTIDDSLKSMGFLGFIVGLTPCAPLFGVLTYIALSVKDALVGAFYTLCFGIGTSIVTPITLLGIFASVIPRLVFKTAKIYEIFKRSCGFMLILMGAKLILSQLLGGSRYW